MVISNFTLIKCGAVGGLATVTMGLLFKNKIDSNIKNTVYCKEALNTLRAHKGAVSLLGEPIKTRLINMGNEKINYTKDTSAHYEIPVKGTKQKGTLYLWASRCNTNSDWFLDRIELGLDSDTSRRLLIKSKTKNS